jgi:uncharacterized protein (DUF697 family)
LATARWVRQARVRGAVAGLVGSLGVLADSAGLAWLQARLVLDVAAAYGRDPAEPERAAELLTLMRVHPDLGGARAALAAAQAANHDGEGRSRLVAQLARAAGTALLKARIARRTARIVPGAGAALTAVLDARSTERLAARATKFYRTPSI